MPELPEVETVLRGITPHCLDKRIHHVELRNRRLRWPITRSLPRYLKDQKFIRISRRAKYLLFETVNGGFLLHLGMSGSLRVTGVGQEFLKHDHVEIQFTDGKVLRFNDPRRFGCLLWSSKDLSDHPRLRGLGVEPLTGDFSASYLKSCFKDRKMSIKQALMDQKIVVGVGNIYVSEVLFKCGIHPVRRCGRISVQRLNRLVESVKIILADAISSGGTTIRDFLDAKSKPGYFSQQLAVYGRENLPCIRCKSLVRRVVISGRSTFYCPKCQK